MTGQSQEAWLNAAGDQAATHALINQNDSYANGPHQLPTGWIAGLMFVGGAFFVPKGRAQLWYALIIPLFIAGCHFLRDGGRTPASESSWWWYGEFHQTPLSLFFFGLSILCFFLLNAEVNRHKRARYYAAVAAAQLDADAAWIAQEPRTLVPATVTRRNDVVPAESHTAPPTPAPAATSKLWLPSSPERRVRRGGTTLSGTPIKDRRSVNPETLFDNY
jgi:hypothetical protein